MYLVPGGVLSPGDVLRPGGVYLDRGGLVQGGVWSGGCLVWGVSGLGGVWSGGVVWSDFFFDFFF